MRNEAGRILDTVQILKVLADETRLRILNLVMEAGDLCSCEIESILQLNQSNASRHLTKLRDAGLVVAEKRGQWVHYQLAKPEDTSLSGRDLQRIAVTAAREDFPVLEEDLRALREYRKSPYRCATIKEWRQVYWNV